MRSEGLTVQAGTMKEWRPASHRSQEDGICTKAIDQTIDRPPPAFPSQSQRSPGTASSSPVTEVTEARESRLLHSEAARGPYRSAFPDGGSRFPPGRAAGTSLPYQLYHSSRGGSPLAPSSRQRAPSRVRMSQPSPSMLPQRRGSPGIGRNHGVLTSNSACLEVDRAPDPPQGNLPADVPRDDLVSGAPERVFSRRTTVLT
jgi:hypothetical protein